MTRHRLFYLLNRAQHLLLKRTNRECWDRLGLSVAQLGALLYLEKHEGCLHKELSEALLLNNSAVTGLVGRMEGSELVERRACPRDRRASRLYLTERASSKLQEARPLLREFNAKLVEGFSDDQVAIVVRFLEAIIAQSAEDEA